MKVCQIVPRLHEEASGPTYSVPRLSMALAEEGNDTTLVSLDVGLEKEYAGVLQKRFSALPLTERLGVSPSMKKYFSERARDFSIIHSHGLWMMPNVYPAVGAYRHGVSFVVSPRGTLGAEALAFSKTKKFFHWRLWQRKALQIASGFHATSDGEAEDIRRAGFRQPIAMIPNGIDLPGQRLQEERTLLFLGRIHPKKGLELAIDSWANVEGKLSDWKFVIVGPGEPTYVEALKARVKTSGAQRVTFHGPVYGTEKDLMLGTAAVLIMPSLNENFGMVAAEALSWGVPVIATEGTPWEGLAQNRCGWWVSRDIESVQGAIFEACSMDREYRLSLGKNGRKWMESEFSWRKVAKKMALYYRWLNDGLQKPDFVDLD